MAMLAINNVGVSAYGFSSPLMGAWNADLTAATNDVTQVQGRQTLSVNDGALKLVGTATANGVFADTVRLRFVAGNGGLGKPSTPRSYQQTSVHIVLNDLLSAAGETLSGTADASVLGTVLANWTVSNQPVGGSIKRLMAKVGASWRMLADGTFWCGQESWPDSGLQYDVTLQDNAHQQVKITTEAPLLMAGMSLGGQHCSYVETHVSPSSVESTVWIGDADRVSSPVVAMVKGAIPQIDFLALYDATVKSQSGDMASVDLIPDDARLSQQGFSNVPLRHGVPGLKVQVVPGARIRIGWANGDESKPFAALWEGTETALKIQLAGTHPAPLFDTFENAMTTWVTAMKTMINALTPVTGIPTIAQTAAATACDVMLGLIAGKAFESLIVSNG